MDDNRMLDINFVDKDMQLCLEKFNELCTTYYPDIKEWDHNELHAMCREIPPYKWRRFLLQEKVKEWYRDEQNIELRKKAAHLIKNAEKNNTAQQATLNNILTQLNKQENNDNKTLIIYNCFTPLSKDEEENPNVNKIQDIPDSIKDAIQIIKKR